MFSSRSVLVIGASYLAFGAGIASAQLDVDTVGRAGGGIGAAGGGVAAGVGGTVRGTSDAQIGVNVQASLSQQLQMPGVRSDVRNGVATLNGTVANEADKQRAEQIARRVEGVTRVRNALVVDGASAASAGGSAGRSVAGSAGASAGQQTRVAAASTDEINSRLRSDAQLAARDIDVRTRNNVVTLTGEVSSVAEKESAGRIAADAAAGAEVRNRLVVRSKE